MEDKIKKIFEAFGVDKVYVDDKAGEVYLTEKKDTKPLSRIDFEQKQIKTKK